jgi:hypothetical protein
MLKRQWGIRHIRAMWARWRFWSWWYDIGQYMGAVPNPADLEYLDAIERGDA